MLTTSLVTDFRSRLKSVTKHACRAGMEGMGDVHQNISYRVEMTAPKQEKWIYRNKEKLNVKFIGAVGGVFDFFSGISLALKSPKKLRQ